MYSVRTLAKLSVNPNIIAMFFRTCVTPVLLYGSVAFYGLLTKILYKELTNSLCQCRKFIKNSSIVLDDYDIIWKKNIISLAAKIVKDETHPLNDCYNIMPSGRRYRMPRIRTARFKHTFIPTSVTLLNER